MIGSSGWLLCTRRQTFGFHKMRVSSLCSDTDDRTVSLTTLFYINHALCKKRFSCEITDVSEHVFYRRLSREFYPTVTLYVISIVYGGLNCEPYRCVLTCVVRRT